MRVLGFILFFAALLLLGSIGVKAQIQTVIPTGATYQTTVQRGGYGADTLFVIPIRDTFCNNFLTLRCRGRITQQPSTNNIYYHDGTKWRGIGGGADSSIFVTLTYLNNVLDGYIQWGDTLNIIATKSDIPQQFDSTYLSQRIDSIVGVLDEYVKYTDTALMLVPYLRKSDAAATYVGFADTSSMLANYLRKADTTSMLLPYLRKVDTASLSARIDARVKYSDTATLIQTRYRADSMNATKWSIGGNTLAGNGSIGLINSGALNFITNNITRASIGSTGQMIIGSASNTIQSVAQMRNDQTTGMFDFIIGRPGGIGANIMVLNFGLFGAANTGTIGYSGTTMNFNTNSILLNNIATTASPSIIGGGLTTGFILNMKPRASIGGGGYNPTSGEAGILDWAIDGSNVWTPASGNANWIGIRPRIVVTAMAPYTGTVRLFDGSCTINSIGAGTLQVYYSSNNVGFSNFHSGTGQNYFQGVITQGTQVNNLSGEGYQSPNPLRASVLRSTNMAAGNLTDSIVSYDPATDELKRIAPITTLITSVGQLRDTTITSNTSVTLLSTVRTYHYSFSGTTATWPLPTVASSFSSGNGVTYFIKNRGSGNLTINTNSGGNDIWLTNAINTITLSPGDAIMLHNDGTYFNVE